MNPDKLTFLRIDLLEHLRSLPGDTQPLFGKMNVCQMIEHMSDAVRIANGKDKHSIVTPEERLKPMKDFMMSEKDFRPNTVNSLLPEMPLPCKSASKEEAIAELETELRDFIAHFESKGDSTVTDPHFGNLNYAEWVHLLYKHALHHLRQFGVTV